MKKIFLITLFLFLFNIGIAQTKLDYTPLVNFDEVKEEYLNFWLASNILEEIIPLGNSLFLIGINNLFSVWLANIPNIKFVSIIFNYTFNKEVDLIQKCVILYTVVLFLKPDRETCDRLYAFVEGLFSREMLAFSKNKTQVFEFSNYAIIYNLDKSSSYKGSLLIITK